MNDESQNKLVKFRERSNSIILDKNSTLLKHVFLVQFFKWYNFSVSTIFEMMEYAIFVIIRLSVCFIELGIDSPYW